MTSGGPTFLRFPVLEARYGPLTPMDQGMQSRVYSTPDGRVVVKVYRNHQGEHRLEAENLRRAGLGEWVLGAVEADGVEALIMRRFPGHPLTAADVSRALPRLREILGALHRERGEAVDLGRLRERLKRFRRALAAYPLDDLFDAVEEPLERGLLDQPSAFCHLDLWQDNILIAPGGEVIVIDWTKAAWDDPLRDIALLKTGTLDLLSPDASLEAALTFLPDREPATVTRLRAYLAHTYLHDLYWFLMNEPYEFDGQRGPKLSRARHVLARLPG
ncbi:aminoglycoside phosphotransferase [Deinococcus aetherius]|uniref:Aminoglycoside phosphotransferase n=1 Tax=Deinococcus aetherius TaxID=200252 RepID=A0ABM8ADV6_9DEIO|nr:aminoglycoside phosphotransferase family protein [Deinococcus aetherius]BDP41968.1 aminoglycoside phosphotransferase [Deinococcus aetherius]